MNPPAPIYGEAFKPIALTAISFSHVTLSNTELEIKIIRGKYSCKQRCGFLLRLRNQGKMYILHNFGKKSKRRKEQWKKERRVEEGKNRGKKSEERKEEKKEV